MSNRFANRILYGLITSVMILGFLIFLFFYIKHQFTTSRTEITETGMVEKITSMGKLELVKYTMKDVVEQKEVYRILPDRKVLLLAVGEVTACIDLTKVKRADIVQDGDSVTVYLPQPEICSASLDHDKSRVYDISGAWFQQDAKNMVESVYKIAERKILENARQMNVTGMARQNAQLIFKPLLESISGKKVTLKFR
ncbi:DUF4230 domain-containing protein [Hufsiella ginkgonis]|uniref:DUF4230 domain-containing protein n=1 Tax=Hufsiella ginkgonis TaxID=2695274 RepID=A0A7K1Y3P4_9SPHI|nr:DUF4230 domain-containing protein [Hufsiella ginkgonis]MXV17738.1 DUF4230 domain-containing protein [Hufsiella ginkgonis]